MDFSSLYLLAISKVVLAKRLSLDSVVSLQKCYDDSFADVAEPCNKLTNNLLYTVNQVLIEKCSMNDNRNVSDRKLYNKNNMLHLPLLSSVSFACGINIERFEECEVWSILEPYVSEKRKLKVINKEFLSNFMYNFSKGTRFYLNRHMIKADQERIPNDYLYHSFLIKADQERMAYLFALLTIFIALIASSLKNTESFLIIFASIVFRNKTPTRETSIELFKDLRPQT